MSNYDHIQKLIRNHNRRLQKLEEEQSLKGFNADPELLIEIEDTRKEIEKLREELSKIDGEPYPKDDAITSGGVQKKSPQPKNFTKEQTLSFVNKAFNRKLLDHDLAFPIYISVDEIANELGQVTEANPEEARGYLTALFDILNIVGAVRIVDLGKIELSDEIHLATMRAMVLGIQEKIQGLFDFTDSEDIENPYYGSWFLHLLERRRQDNNPQREESRLCDTVVVLVKAKLDGEDAILFQSDGQRAWGKYKLIGGRVRNLDRGLLSDAIRREIQQEVRTKVSSASNIRVWLLSEEPLQYYVMSRRLGAYSLYRTYLYECTLDLPDGCLKESFQGEKGRETTWFPITKITPENEMLSQTDILRWIQSNGWFEMSRLSTRQTIESDSSARSK